MPVFFKRKRPRFNLTVRNRGREIVATDFWDEANGGGEGRTCWTLSDYGALRILLGRGLDVEAAEAARGKMAVMSIGLDETGKRAMAGVMFDDGTDDSLELETELVHLNAVPDESWCDPKNNPECLVYTEGLKLVARMPLYVRWTHVPDFRPAGWERDRVEIGNP